MLLTIKVGNASEKGISERRYSLKDKIPGNTSDHRNE